MQGLVKRDARLGRRRKCARKCGLASTSRETALRGLAIRSAGKSTDGSEAGKIDRRCGWRMHRITPAHGIVALGCRLDDGTKTGPCLPLQLTWRLRGDGWMHSGSFRLGDASCSENHLFRVQPTTKPELLSGHVTLYPSLPFRVI